MPKIKMLGSLIALSAVGITIAFAADDAATIQKKLAAEFSQTKTTADLTDIVTAGSILVLQKDNMVLSPTTTTALGQNTYKDGKISQNAAVKAKSAFSKLGRIPGVSMVPGVGAAAGAAGTADAASGASPRTYVTGEKMWVTKIEVKTDGKDEIVVFDLFTDAVSDIRYKGQVRMVYPKGASADQVNKLVGEVFKVQPPEDQKDASAGGGQQQQQQKGAPAVPAAREAAPPAIAPPPPPAENAAPPDIPPPPPPTDAPPATIGLKQTIEQVVAIMGQPTRIANLGTKQIYYYKDLKVTFTAGKVTDVQ
jgi:hypothetical protein